MSKKLREDRKNLKLAQLRDIGREITQRKKSLNYRYLMQKKEREKKRFIFTGIFKHRFTQPFYTHLQHFVGEEGVSVALPLLLGR